MRFRSGVSHSVWSSAGFTSGGANPPAALSLLTLLYAAIPCALKVAALALLATLNLSEA